ncbi:MAG: hypothetical protein IPI92_20110 [Gemmatimonadetes bacterium]|nr:hypothetical protein [Gemmatimonadota bacterium]MBK8759267.1 hypothetical protein [Sulfuritalea sp.]
MPRGLPPVAGFKKGASGNPGGRPKKTPEQITLEEKCKEMTPEALATITQIMTDGENERNRLAAAQYVIDRGWGKARQEVVGTMDHNLAVTMITRRIIGGDGPKSGN